MKTRLILAFILIIFIFQEFSYAEYSQNCLSGNLLNKSSIASIKNDFPSFRLKNWSLLSGTLLGAASCAESPFKPEDISKNEYGFLARKLLPYPNLRRAFLTLNIKSNSLSKYILLSDRIIKPDTTSTIYFICPFDNAKVNIIQSMKPANKNILLKLSTASNQNVNLITSKFKVTRLNVQQLSKDLHLTSTEPYVLTINNSSTCPVDYALIIKFDP